MINYFTAILDNIVSFFTQTKIHLKNLRSFKLNTQTFFLLLVLLLQVCISYLSIFIYTRLVWRREQQNLTLVIEELKKRNQELECELLHFQTLVKNSENAPPVDTNLCDYFSNLPPHIQQILGALLFISTTILFIYLFRSNNPGNGGDGSSFEPRIIDYKTCLPDFSKEMQALSDRLAQRSVENGLVTDADDASSPSSSEEASPPDSPEYEYPLIEEISAFDNNSVFEYFSFIIKEKFFSPLTKDAKNLKSIEAKVSQESSHEGGECLDYLNNIFGNILEFHEFIDLAFALFILTLTFTVVINIKKLLPKISSK
jgi:hypothetical protein